MSSHFILEPNWRHSCVFKSFSFGNQLGAVLPVAWPDWMRRHKIMRPPYLFDPCWCPGCKHRVRTAPFEGIAISLIEPPPPIPLAATGGGDVWLMHQRLIDVLDGDAIREFVRYGSVQLKEGSVSKDWHSVVFRVRKILRRSENVEFRICPCCGRVVYFAMGLQFIWPNRSDVAIMGGNEIIVSESFLTQKKRQWISGEKGLSLVQVKTTQKPLDGFDFDLPWYADENPSIFRRYLAARFVEALMVNDARDRWLDLAIAHSEMNASGNDITSVLPFLEARLSPTQKGRLEDFLSLEEKKKSVLPLYESRGFTVDLHT